MAVALALLGSLRGPNRLSCRFVSNRGSHPLPSAGKKKGPNVGPFYLLAERVGFEPTKGYKPLLVFKTSAFDHSATSPVPGLVRPRILLVASARFNRNRSNYNANDRETIEIALFGTHKRCSRRLMSIPVRTLPAEYSRIERVQLTMVESGNSLSSPAMTVKRGPRGSKAFILPEPKANERTSIC